MLCPHCGSKIRPNKGWAALFYDGYCNFCDMNIKEGIAEPEKIHYTEDCRDCLYNANTYCAYTGVEFSDGEICKCCHYCKTEKATQKSTKKK